jgi:hypothetical protein
MNDWPIEARERLMHDIYRDRVEALESDNAFLRARIRILELRLERRSAVVEGLALTLPQAG